MVSGCTAGNPPVVTVSSTPTPVPVMTTAPLSAQSCITDDDCVPAQCCHPTSCTNKANKGVCNLHDELRGTDRLWCRQLRVCKREMQCSSIIIITPYNRYKTTVITPLPRETFISHERDDSTWHCLHG
jgi:hypothetical protein